MGIRICTITVFSSLFVAAAQSPSQAQSTMVLPMAVQAPPVAQPPRVPGEPPRAPQSPPVSRPPESPKNDQLTVTGCIEQGQAHASTREPSATGTSGTSGKASGTSKVSKFILTNPKLQGASAGAPNSSTSSSSPASGGMYQLDARDSKLSPHVGHQVEVIGSIKSGSSDPDAPKLKVENIKMISTSCDRDRRDGFNAEPAETAEILGFLCELCGLCVECVLCVLCLFREFCLTGF